MKKILFLTIMILGFSVAASAQKDQDGKKTPPKEGKPPVIVVKPKGDEKPKDKPKDNDKKKPTAYLKGYSENKKVIFA